MIRSASLVVDTRSVHGALSLIKVGAQNCVGPSHRTCSLLPDANSSTRILGTSGINAVAVYLAILLVVRAEILDGVDILIKLDLMALSARRYWQLCSIRRLVTRIALQIQPLHISDS